MKECVSDPIAQEDFEDVANRGLPLEELRGRAVLITGATGLIGSRLVFTLACINRLHGLKVKIYALVRDYAKAERVFRDILDREDFHIFEADIMRELDIGLDIGLDIDGDVDYVIHGANPTSSKDFITSPADVASCIVVGTNNLLDFSRKKGARGFVYLSSMEAYGQTEGIDRLKEGDFGYLDPDNPRSCYPFGKRAAEGLCRDYSERHGLHTKIARLAQTFGAGIDYDDPRVFAQFARSVIEKRDIVLHTKGAASRSYCYVSDAVAAILLILLRGESGEMYNVANKNCAMSIREMADLVAKEIAGGNIKVAQQLEDDAITGYLPEMRLVLDAGKIEALGWQPKRDMPAMYERLIGSMRHNAK